MPGSPASPGTNRASSGTGSIRYSLLLQGSRLPCRARQLCNWVSSKTLTQRTAMQGTTGYQQWVITAAPASCTATAYQPLANGNYNIGSSSRCGQVQGIRVVSPTLLPWVLFSLFFFSHDLDGHGLPAPGQWQPQQQLSSSRCVVFCCAFCGHELHGQGVPVPGHWRTLQQVWPSDSQPAKTILCAFSPAPSQVAFTLCAPVDMVCTACWTLATSDYSIGSCGRCGRLQGGRAVCWLDSCSGALSPRRLLLTSP